MRRLTSFLAALLTAVTLSLPYYAPRATAQSLSGGIASTGGGITLPDWYINTLTYPQFADNAAMVAKDPANYTGVGYVVRYKLDDVHPKRPLVFTPLSGSCATNGLIPDGFHCSDATSGNSWKGQVPDNGLANVEDFGAIHDGSSHPISEFPTIYKDLATTALICPSIQYLAGYTTTATTTNGNASITLTGTYKPYVVPGQHITGTNIPASTYIGTVNYSTGVATLVQSDRTTAQNATGTGSVSLTASQDFTWDNISSDWCAIDGAISAAKTSAGAGGYYRSPWAPSGKYILNAGINLTCINVAGAANSNCPNAGSHGPFSVYLNGSFISFANMSAFDYGAAGVDMMGSFDVTLSDATLYGGALCDGTQPLKRGIQMGHITTAVSANHNLVRNVTTLGGYRQTPFYNEGSESSGTFKSDFQNCDSTGDAYNGIWDSGFHWLPTSSYTPVTGVQDVPQTFNDPYDFESFFRLGTGGTGGGLWIYGSRAINLQGTYIVSSGHPLITLYSGTAGGGDGASIAAMPNFQVHGEGTYASEISVVSRSAGGTPTIKDLTLRDHNTQATASLFALGANTTSVTLSGKAGVDIQSSTSAITLFDDGSKWTVPNFKDIFLPVNITGFNPTIGGSNAGTGATYTCASTVCTPRSGMIRITAGSGSGTQVSTTVTFPFLGSASRVECAFHLKGAGANWDNNAHFRQRGSPSTTIAAGNEDNNGVALVNGSTYDVLYGPCWGLE